MALFKREEDIQKECTHFEVIFKQAAKIYVLA